MKILLATILLSLVTVLYCYTLQINQNSDNKSEFSFLVVDKTNSSVIDVKFDKIEYIFKYEYTDQYAITWYETNKESEDFERLFSINLSDNITVSEPRLLSFDYIYSVNYYREYTTKSKYILRLTIDTVMRSPNGDRTGITGAILLNKLEDTTNYKNDPIHKCCIYMNTTAKEEYKLCSKCMTSYDEEPNCNPLNICKTSETDYAQFLLVDEYWAPYCCLCRTNTTRI